MVVSKAKESKADMDMMKWNHDPRKGSLYIPQLLSTFKRLFAFAEQLFEFLITNLSAQGCVYLFNNNQISPQC